MAAISKTTWHQFPAITLESARMRVIMVPDLGAKIVSLFDKTHHHEWLVPPMRAPRQTEYAAVFVDQDMSGWDEMMPTIDACTYQGIQLPDHGEVWGIPWTVESVASEAVLSVSGVAMPYRLIRSAAMTADNELKLSYTLINTGSTPFQYLWAAHPQFAADPQTRILLPPEVTQVVNIIEKDALWGENGTFHNWPQAMPVDSQVFQLDQVVLAEKPACRKFYIPPQQHIAWAALSHTGLGCQMRLSWRPEDLPYLGIWVDQGMFNTEPVAALEPSNGFYDSLARAAGNGTATQLAPAMEKHWELNIQID